MANSMRLGRVGVAIVAASIVALLASVLVPFLRPAATPLAGAKGPVVVVGMTGVPWEAVGPRTPTLSTLASDAVLANVSVRTFDLTTCSFAGWVTLNTGVRTRGVAQAGQSCTEAADLLAGGVEAHRDRLAVWDHILANNEGNLFTPEFGALGSTITRAGKSVAAVGGGGAVAIANADGVPYGKTVLVPSRDGVNQSIAEAYGKVKGADVVVVDLGTAHRDSTPSSALEAAFVPPGKVSARTRSAAERIDAQLGALVEQLEPGTTLIVTSLGDADRQTARLQIFMETVIGQNAGGGATTGGAATGGAATGGVATSATDAGAAASGGRLLTSASTRQPGLIQNVDVHAAILDALAIPTPPSAAGATLSVYDQRATPADLAEVNARAIMTRAMVGLFYTLFVVGAGVIYIGMTITIRGGRFGIHHAFSLLVSAAMPAASLLINLLPWWSAGRFSAVTFTLGILAIATAIAGAAMWLVHTAPMKPLTDPERGGFPAVAHAAVLVALVTALTLGIDALLGSPLHASSVLGDQPQSGGRFYGMSNAPFAIWAVSMLFLALIAARHLAGHRRARLGVVVILGLVAIVIDGAPNIGADFGGPPPLLIGFGVLTFWAAGVRLTPLRAGATAIGAIALAILISWLDWLRDTPTHLGAFFQSLIDGQALSVIARKAHQLGTQVPWPAWIIAGAVLVAGFYYLRRTGLHPLHDRGDFPELSVGALAAFATLMVGMLINDSGLVIPLIGGIYMAGLWGIAGLDGNENERYGRKLFEAHA
ncbi:hypothetical protein INS90_10600 [Trueperella pecoris]|uniref:Uncharacterized protein n=1 Tax=Trueperella pecoris TaxID=2733571 RepID=A0A7M1R072_9ACTO|nr:hypothetical protein [Trueperella pecoris]QOR47670.1 hypothetical protein INS90_10600 [Trueperella pecoris]